MAKGFPTGKGGMLKQLQQLQRQLEEAQARLAEETVTVSVGGGAVTITMTGDQKCQAVQIDPALLEDADAEMLQDMILSAINRALDESRELATKFLGSLTGGLPF